MDKQWALLPPLRFQRIRTLVEQVQSYQIAKHQRQYYKKQLLPEVEGFPFFEIFSICNSRRWIEGRRS